MQPPEADRVLCELAGRQFGRLARWQLVPLGFDDDAIRHRLTRDFVPHRRGIYCFGHAPDTIEARWMTDLLRCGPESGIGATTALQLVGVLRRNRRWTVVITAKRGRRKPKGIDLRESRDVEFVEWGDFPVTPLGRSLLDAASMLDDEQLEAAYEKAVKLFDLDPSTIPPRDKRLNQIVRDHVLGTAMTDSELENLFRRIVKRAGLPQPRSNQAVWTGERHYFPDFLWPERKLIVEIMGWHVHRDRQEADTRRKANLSAMGFVVVEFMKLQMIRRPDEVARALRPFL